MRNIRLGLLVILTTASVMKCKESVYFMQRDHDTGAVQKPKGRHEKKDEGKG